MILNIANVEELVFYNEDVWRRLPELARYRDQWRISLLSPALRLTGKRAMSEFLSAARGAHERSLSEIFGTSVTIDTIDSRVVRNLEFHAKDEFPEADSTENNSGFALYREGDRVFATLWR